MDRDTPNPLDPIIHAVKALSDCLLASHPDTPRMGTVPEMMLAEVKEIEGLRDELRITRRALLNVSMQNQYFAIEAIEQARKEQARGEGLRQNPQYKNR